MYSAYNPTSPSLLNSNNNSNNNIDQQQQKKKNRNPFTFLFTRQHKSTPTHSTITKQDVNKQGNKHF